MQGNNARVGYRFFTQDDKGALHEFYWRGLQDRTAYFALLRQIAQLIIERLDLKTSGNKEEPPARRTIFLAVAAHELRDARQRLVNDLRSAGVAVVPAIDALPDTAVDYEASDAGCPVSGRVRGASPRREPRHYPRRRR